MAEASEDTVLFSFSKNYLPESRLWRKESATWSRLQDSRGLEYGTTFCRPCISHVPLVLLDSNDEQPDSSFAHSRRSAKHTLILFSQCSGSADYPWFRHARPGLTTHNLPFPDADQQVNVANIKPTEHDVVVDAGGGPSDVVSNHVPKQLNAPVGSETPSNATKKYAWPVSTHTANLPDDDLSRFRIHHYFDYVAGTSTGG